MKIVALDGYAMNPGDLSWDEIKTLGDFTAYDRTPPDKLIKRAKDADGVLINKVQFDRDVLAQLPELRYIGVQATGYNVVDIQAAREAGVVVTNVPAYSTTSVVQHTFALLLELANRVGHHAQTVRDGRWAANPDFTYWDFPLLEIDGLTMGIVGFGAIGRGVAKVALALGMKVLANSRRTIQNLPEGIEQTDLLDLLRRSDVVSLHCPLTPETEGMINAERLSLMKQNALLLNTGRGPLVVEQDLADALTAGTIAGAGLDVLSKEPPSADNPLFKAPNCFITPHNAWGSLAARQRLIKVVAENIRAFINGKPQNVVS